jgi:hypothetical protein
MAGRGMGAATKGGGAVESGPKNKMVSETSTKTGPVMMALQGRHDGQEDDGRWRHDEEGLCCWWCC